METRARKTTNGPADYFANRVVAGALAGALLLIGMPTAMQAQSAAGQSPQAPPAGSQPAGTKASVPQWQIDAGGKATFDVASIKPDTAAQSQQTVHSNIPLGPMDMYAPTGGRLDAANYPLIVYMVFAYKLTSFQIQDLAKQLPKWANTDRYDIQAKAESQNPSKDQMRLMMQALLAERFKLAVHYETKQMPVMALLLDKPGKLGPHLRAHVEDVPCTTALVQGPAPPPTIAGGYPESCGALMAYPVSGRAHVGGRNMDIQVVANQLTGLVNGIDRPILDKTGLTGKYDFFFEFMPQFNGPLPPGTDFQTDETAPPFQEALKKDLGLKMESQTGPVDVLVIDHVEQPSEN
jgi:uncharacterized protein (TIGR03435 family)